MTGPKSQKSAPLLQSRSPFTGHGAMLGLVAAVIVAGYLVVHFTLASSCTVSATLVNSCRPWIGAAVFGDPRAASSPISQFSYLESAVGHQLDIFHDYDAAGSLPLSSDEIHYIQRSNTYAYIDWKPASTWTEAGGSNNAVNAGIRAAADNIKAVSPHKIFLSIWSAPENDVASGTSCATRPGAAGTPADYRAMWQNVESTFRAEGATNVVWVMNYTGASKWDCVVPQLWPGNNLVNWVTFDAFGTDQQPTWDATVGRMYNVLSADSSPATDFDALPWGVAEFGTCAMTNERSSDNYYKSAKTALDTNQFPKLKLYMVYDDTAGAGLGCLTDSSIRGTHDTTKQASFNAFANDPVFTESFTPPSQGVPTSH